MKRTEAAYIVVHDAYEKKSTEELLQLQQEFAHLPNEMEWALSKAEHGELPWDEVLGRLIQVAVMTDALEDVLAGREGAT